jgi:hypothetical protein
MRRLLVILVSTLCWGCFVLDEIDSGQKEMDRYDSKNKGKTGEAAAAPQEKQMSSAERARAWWDKARTFEPRADDEKSDIVSCKVDGTTRFMSQADCTNSGGHFSSGG